MPESISFGAWLRQHRRALDLTQKTFADQVGCAEITVRRMEADEYKPSNELALVLFEKLGIPEPERTQWVRFARGISNLPIQSIPQPNKPNSNLPVSLTSFIGREKEQQEVVGIIDKHRLITLTGPGGCGKTRLALQAASGLLEVFPDGIWLVELAPLTDPALVLQTVVVVLGLKEEVGRSLLSTLTNHLRAKQVLLILDNCEHLVEASAQLAESLLKVCPDVHILATSREVLDVAGEISFLVPSLSSPDVQHPIQVDMLTQYESVQLFVDRAVTALPGFMVTNDNAPAMAQVCHRLDGIPLAIELAAARVKLLRVEQIAERLDDRFQLLASGGRTALPRHQTLAALIDWSHELLTEPERALFCRLSVFAGGWALEAAEVVCAGEAIESAGILDLLTQLVNKSLVIAERKQGAETRYRMLETILQYSLEKLTAGGKTDVVRRRHAEYYLTLAEAGEMLAQPTWLDHMETEYDNLRVALAWSQSATGSAELGLRLTAAIVGFWGWRGSHSEERIWLEGALVHADAEGIMNTPGRAKILVELVDWNGFENYETSQALMIQSLRIFQELGDLSASGHVIHRLGWLAREHGDTATARFRLEESVKLYRELGDKAGLAGALLTLGEVVVMQEDAVLATALLEEALSLSRQLEHILTTGWVLNHLGHVAQIQGEYERATQLHEESLILFNQIGPQHTGTIWMHQGFGETALAQGDTVLATKHFVEALVLSRDLGDKASTAWCLAGLAGVAALNEKPERAAWLWGAAEALRQSIGAREAPASHATHERLKNEVRKQLGETAFNAKWAEGQVASVEQAINEAIL